MRMLHHYMENESRKLAALVEGAVRSILACDHGKEYTLARKVGSLQDVSCYVQDMRSESDNWLARAERDFVDI